MRRCDTSIVIVFAVITAAQHSAASACVRGVRARGVRARGVRARSARISIKSLSYFITRSSILSLEHQRSNTYSIILEYQHSNTNTRTSTLEYTGTPYHIGKTCEQNEKGDTFTESSACRFCDVQLKDRNEKKKASQDVRTRTLKDVQTELTDAMKRMDRAAISRLMLERAQMQQSGASSQKAPEPAPKIYKDDMSIMCLNGHGQFVHVKETNAAKEESSIYSSFTFETWIKPRGLKKFSLDDAEDEEQVDSIMDANAQLERMYRDRGKSVVFSKGALFWNEMNPQPDRLSDEEVEKNTFDESPPPMPGFCVLFQPMTKEITVRIVSVSFSDGSLPKIFVSEVRSILKDEAEKWYHIACTFSEQTRTWRNIDLWRSVVLCLGIHFFTRNSMLERQVHSRCTSTGRSCPPQRHTRDR